MGQIVIFSSFQKALAQLSDKNFKFVLLKGIGLSIALLFVAYLILSQGLQLLLPNQITLPFIGTFAFVDQIVSWGSLVLMLVLSVFLMIPVASAFTGLFLDEVADAVEAHHYPHLAPASRLGISDNIRESLNFLGIMILANLLALIFYFTPLAPFVFFGLNGFLLGREYFRLTAVRRIGRDAAKSAFRKNLVTIWAAGALMAIPLTIPVVNILIPVLGAATFTHIFHRLQK